MICQRCAKDRADIHTCSPSALVRKLEAKNAELLEVMEQMGEELHILHGVFPSNALAAYRKLKEGECRVRALPQTE